MDEGKEVRAVFCDISKAFNRVWHGGLITKLSSFGICDSLLNWIISYLSNRKQRVVYANSTSSWRHIQAGVPQGSILGPLFFLAYINDIVSAVNSNIRLFADDTSPHYCRRSDHCTNHVKQRPCIYTFVVPVLARIV